jgi:hypothetical protein
MPTIMTEVDKLTIPAVQKDCEVLRQAYWEAGIREYWLVDARNQAVAFEILRYSARGYVSTTKSQGWLKSTVFHKSFRLVHKTNSLGYPEYTLKIR